MTGFNSFLHVLPTFTYVLYFFLQYLSKQNVDRHNKGFKQSTLERLAVSGSGAGRESKHSTMAPSDVEYYDNGNISPLYSNWVIFFLCLILEHLD